MTTSNVWRHIKNALLLADKIGSPTGAFLCALFFCSILLPTEGSAKDRITIAEEYKDSQNFKQFLEFYDPGIQETNLADIIKMEAQKWRSINEISPKLIFSPDHTLWFRFSIDNKSNELQQLVLYNKNPLSNETSVYICASKEKESCEKRNTEETVLKIPQESSRTILIEITGLNPAYPFLSLESIDNFNKNQYNKKLYSGIINGVILGLTLYTLLLAIKTRQPAYYAYSFLGTCTLLTALVHQEVFSVCFHRINNKLEAELSLVMPVISSIAIMQFIREFLDSKKNNNLIDKILLAFITIDIIISTAFMLGAPLAILLPFFMASSGIVITLLLYSCAIQKKHPHTSIAFLTIGITMPIMGGILTASVGMGFIESNINYMQTAQTIDAIEMMLFSLAVLSSVKHMEKEHTRQYAITLEAETISEAHNKLLAHLNHELRTPLNGILGAAEILVHKSHPRDRHIFSMICHTALPLKHLIDEMVDISAVTKNKKHLQNIRFDLQNLLQECMDVFLPTANEKNIRFFFTVEHDIANDVTGDPNRLRQILLNLIGNACKFTTNGEVGLFVRKESSLSENKCLYYFEVTDSGMGISKVDEQRLFRIFETNNSTANPKGAGLGLSIVRELSELLGGSCGYANNLINGSKFWFTATLEPHQKIHRKTHKAFEGLSILIADESPALCGQLLNHVLCAANNVETTNSPESISLDIQSRKYNLVLIHNTLLNESIEKILNESNVFYIHYYDQNEINDIKKEYNIYRNDVIARKISTEAFSLQIADYIIKKSNLIYKKENSQNNTSRKKILAADDIPSNQHIIKELIESLGYSAVICEDGKKAFNLYKQYLLEDNPFDAIIMDCEMPVQDGFDTTKQIREYEKIHNVKPTPIIALTAHTESTYRLLSEQAGMDAYLTKPVTAERILQCLLDAENT